MIFLLHVFYFHSHNLFDCECVACAYAISNSYPMGIDICNSNAYTVEATQSYSFEREGDLEFVSLFLIILIRVGINKYITTEYCNILIMLYLLFVERRKHL